jgi:hypothetical protein
MSELAGSANNDTAATLGSLDDLIQGGACQIIQQTSEAELTTLLERYDNARTRGDKRALLRSGHLREREAVAAIAFVPAQSVAIADGYRQSTNSSVEMLLDLK